VLRPSLLSHSFCMPQTGEAWADMEESDEERDTTCYTDAPYDAQAPHHNEGDTPRLQARSQLAERE
jgi:hypothetical protein